MALVGSISIAKRLSKPFTFVASLENFCPNASERLCAGSVDCVRVRRVRRVRVRVRVHMHVHVHERVYNGWKGVYAR